MKEAELDDDAVAKAIIAIVASLPKLGSGKEVEQGRIGSALSKKERVVSLSLLTVCVYRGFVPGFVLQKSCIPRLCARLCTSEKISVLSSIFD